MTNTQPSGGPEDSPLGPRPKLVLPEYPDDENYSLGMWLGDDTSNFNDRMQAQAYYDKLREGGKDPANNQAPPDQAGPGTKDAAVRRTPLKESERVQPGDDVASEITASERPTDDDDDFTEDMDDEQNEKEEEPGGDGGDCSAAMDWGTPA